MKKIISLFLSLTMLLSLTAGLDFSAYAETIKGECGENVTYSFDSKTGTLIISGTGDMYFSDYSEFYKNIKVVIIEKGVTSIVYCAFENCTSLTSVTIPDSVTSIGYCAFRDCKSLTSVTIPDSVTSIGYEAFYECTNLTSVTIPDSVTSIEENTFYGCKSLTSVTMPNSVTSIGYFAFYDCTSLTSVTIPKGVTSITIPKGVTSIGNSAFGNCISLISVTIPDGITSIGPWAFCDCKSLTSVTIPKGVTSIDNSAFENCISLTSVTIPDSVTSIGYSAFGYCKSLTSVTIPDSVTSIGEYAFYDCTSLTSITIPKGVTSMGDSAFGYCKSLTSVTIPDGITSIGDHAFYGCSKLSDVTIPKSVTKIGCGAFGNCSLPAVVIKQKKISIKSDSFDYDTVFLCDSSTGIKEANCDFAVRYIDKANKVTDFSKFNDKYEYKRDALYQWDENDKIVNKLYYFTASKTGTYYSGSNAIFDSDYNLVKSKRLNDVIDDGYDHSGYSFQLTKGKKYYFTNGVIIKDFVYYDNGKQYIDGDISYDCLKAIFPDNKVRKFAYIANKDKLKNTQKSQFCGKSVEFKLKKPVTVKSFDVINSNKIDDNFLKNLHKDKVDNSKVTFRLNLSDSSKYTIKNSSVDFRAGWYEYGEFGRYGKFNCKDGRVFGIRFGYNDNKPGKMEIAINKHTKTITMNKNRKHTYKSVVTPATSKKNGKIEKKCSVCKNVESKKTIYKASKISISNKTYTYDGKAKKPTVTVKDSKGKKLSKGKDYTVSYSSGRKNVGRYAVKIKLKGNYSGTVTKTFDIVPKGTSIKKISASKKSFKVYWKAQKKNTTGYEIQYSTAKSFKNAKTVKVSKNSATSQSVAKLSGKKKYFVRVRTYKTVKFNGKKCKVCSSWSTPKTVVTKK